MPAYRYDGRVDCDMDLDLSGLSGKTAVVTGGMSEAFDHAVYK